MAKERQESAVAVASTKASQRRKNIQPIQEQIAANRVENLKDVIQKDYAGSVAFLCRKNELSRSRASHISQVLGGHRKLGEQGARQLEADIGLAVGALDKKRRPKKADEPKE